MVAFRGLPTGYEIVDGLGVTERIFRVIEGIIENLESFKGVNDSFLGDYLYHLNSFIL
jgi:hypothetical protein